MKPLFRMIAMLPALCLLQHCQDLSIEPLQSKDTRTETKAFKELKTQHEKHAFTISAIVRDDYNLPPNQFLVTLRGTPGSITVNWGDGTSDIYALDDNFMILEKIYASPGRYMVRVTGDVKNITYFQSSYDQGVFDAINLKPLTGLTALRIGLTDGPLVIDLRHNKNLEELSLTDIDELTEVLLPKQHSLVMVSIAGPNNLSASTVNAVINSVYQTAVKRGIYGGYFNVRKLYYEEESNEMAGPPSPEALARLRELRDVYNWEVVPDLTTNQTHERAAFP